jgi:hypothetical protein
VGGLFAAEGTPLTEIAEPGTYWLIVFAVVQNDDGYYCYQHADSCAVKIESG